MNAKTIFLSGHGEEFDGEWFIAPEDLLWLEKNGSGQVEIWRDAGPRLKLTISLEVPAVIAIERIPGSDWRNLLSLARRIFGRWV